MGKALANKPSKMNEPRHGKPEEIVPDAGDLKVGGGWVLDQP